MNHRPLPTIFLVALLQLLSLGLLCLPFWIEAATFIKSLYHLGMLIPWFVWPAVVTTAVTILLVFLVTRKAIMANLIGNAVNFGTIWFMSVQSYHPASRSSIYAWGASVLALLYADYLFAGIIGIYRNKKLRWWRQAFRFFVNISCYHSKGSYSVSGQWNEREFSLGQISNISRTGLLLVTPSSSDLAPGDQVSIGFQCLLIPFSLKLKIVRKYQKGNELCYGGTYVDLKRGERGRIRKLCRLLTSLGVETRSRRFEANLKNGN